MKLSDVRIDEEKHVLEFLMESESTKETALLVESANNALKPVNAHGHIGESGTWVWFRIPLAKNPKPNYIGNDL